MKSSFSIHFIQMGRAGVCICQMEPIFMNLGAQCLKLSNQINLRSEICFNSWIWAGSYYEKKGFVLAPVITVESRWYYNLNKCIKK